MRSHLLKQEATLRAFLRAYPADERHFAASIRLSGVLAAEGRLLKNGAPQAEAQKILAGLSADPGVPASVKADAGYALITQDMEAVAGQSSDAQREALLSAIHGFQETYPTDRRIAGLLVEIATLYDTLPARKTALLDEAAARTTDNGLRARISDDRKRLALLGQPLAIGLQPWPAGAPVQLAALRGHVVVLCFWASWSAPSLRELEQLQQTAAHFSGQTIDYFTISLDKDRKAVSATYRAADLRWPVICDGRGWEGEMVRTLGINALPTVWVLDRQGRLLALNAHGAAVGDLIGKALLSR